MATLTKTSPLAQIPNTSLSPRNCITEAEKHQVLYTLHGEQKVSSVLAFKPVFSHLPLKYTILPADKEGRFENTFLIRYLTRKNNSHVQKLQEILVGKICSDLRHIVTIPPKYVHLNVISPKAVLIPSYFFQIP